MWPFSQQQTLTSPAFYLYIDPATTAQMSLEHCRKRRINKYAKVEVKHCDGKALLYH
jgi:hypothetical protein